MSETLRIEGMSLRHQGQLLVRDASLVVNAGEIVGLVGESGSGKTLMSLALIGALPAGISMSAGLVELKGRPLPVTGSGVQRSAADIAMIFQKPKAALNPVMTVGRQIARVLRRHDLASGRQAARDMTRQLLSDVGVAGAERVANSYPHQLSGGLCQRVMIAMAMSCRPSILIADEATTALDVTIQAQIFNLLEELVASTGAGMIFISHDLAAVRDIADRVYVMYGGQLMESAPVADVVDDPHHPYSRHLVRATEGDVSYSVSDEGVDYSVSGCRFANRCALVSAGCSEWPPMRPVGPAHEVACVNVEIPA